MQQAKRMLQTNSRTLLHDYQYQPTLNFAIFVICNQRDSMKDTDRRLKLQRSRNLKLVDIADSHVATCASLVAIYFGLQHANEYYNN